MKKAKKDLKRKIIFSWLIDHEVEKELEKKIADSFY